MARYKANEAFSAMEYTCDKCGNIELVYNMRDSVTPFGFSCHNCDAGMMSHTNWSKDQRLPENFKVPIGSLQFLNLTPETALERAKAQVASCDGTKFELQGADREEMIYSLINNFLEDCCSCEIKRKEAGGAVNENQTRENH